MMNVLKKYIKNPVVQLILVIVVVATFWTWNISTSSYDQYREPVMQPQQLEMTIPDSVMDNPELYRKFTLPDTVVVSEESDKELPPPRKESLEELEYKYRFWDMILGHISSILGSLVALGIPIYRIFKNKNE